MVSNREVMMVGKMVVVVDGSHSMSCLSLPLARAKHNTMGCDRCVRALARARRPAAARVAMATPRAMAVSIRARLLLLLRRVEEARVASSGRALAVPLHAATIAVARRRRAGP